MGIAVRGTGRQHPTGGEACGQVPRHRYSDSRYWIMSAGIFPADAPRFVVAIMLDAPQGGASAAPLFHDIASYLAQRYQVPLSPAPAPTYGAN